MLSNIIEMRIAAEIGMDARRKLQSGLIVEFEEDDFLMFIRKREMVNGNLIVLTINYLLSSEYRELEMIFCLLISQGRKNPDDFQAEPT